jgi:hypothetical protein
MTEEEAALRRKFPACFNSAMRPLKLNIHLDLKLKYPDPTLAAWTRSPIYLRNCLKPGAKRIDLKGHAVADITLAERLYAWERLMFLRSELVGLRWRPLTADERQGCRGSRRRKIDAVPGQATGPQLKEAATQGI